MDDFVMKRAETWLNGPVDEATKKQVRKMMKEAPEELSDAFYKDLEFGTGGMRGKMGPGTNRMNIYTVGMATQGLSNYLKKSFSSGQIKVAIAHDCRHNNTLFTDTAAHVLSANGIKVYRFKGMRPTPLLSFAVRYLGCQSGIVITASHNPKEYNGYKVYWDDGAQLVPPHDNNVINEVRSISSLEEVKFDSEPVLEIELGTEVDIAFVKQLMWLATDAGLTGKEKTSIVYTPLHGTGKVFIPDVLIRNGFANTHVVEEQMVEDGDFPTAQSPNPEEPAALEMALAKAKKINADLVMATDPDADRIGLAVKNHQGKFVLLNGNQTGAILVRYILEKWRNEGRIKGNEFTIKTIVTSELLKDISEKYGIKQYDTLTGFKWIADVIRRKEEHEHFIVGLEESFGYMIGGFVRDKDSVTPALVIAQMATEAANEGKTLFDKLMDIYLEYGLYKEGLVNIYKEGKSGAEEITAMMDAFRNSPPGKLGGSQVVQLKDFKSLELKNLKTGDISKIDLPASNVLQFITEDGSKISIRPSGTEPKIKFYFSVRENLDSIAEYEAVSNQIDRKIELIKEDLQLG